MRRRSAGGQQRWRTGVKLPFRAADLECWKAYRSRQETGPTLIALHDVRVPMFLRGAICGSAAPSLRWIFLMNLHKPARPTLRSALSTASLLAVAGAAGCVAWRVAQTVNLARASEALNVTPDMPGASLLIVGDSTGVGTGAGSPQTSLAGLLASAYPNLRIVNLARDGAKFGAIAYQLAGTERFDMILILGGGNDVIRMTSEATLRDNLDRAITRATTRSDHVIVMPAGNVGNAPFFFAPLSWWMSRRARVLHDAASDMARAHGASFVDLYRDRNADPFAQAPDNMHARDRLHPSDAGYAFWFSELERQAHVSQIVGSAGKRAAAISVLPTLPAQNVS